MQPPSWKAPYVRGKYLRGQSGSKTAADAPAGWGLPGALSIALAAPIVYIGGQLIGAPGL